MNIISLALFSHIMIGLIGVIASYAVLMSISRKEPHIPFLKYTSLIAFVSYILSWLSGGYYYVVHYGVAVKPIIKAGEYPWAHALFTESKEHLFLFLPALSFILVLATWLMGDVIMSNSRVQKMLMVIAASIVLLGTFITLSGVIISGAAR